MKTRQQFEEAALAAVSEFPTAAQFAQVGDPRQLANLRAMAYMLAEMSMEMDVQAMEQFTMARDVTVMANAAVKGVLPFGQPARVQVSVENGSTAPVTINAGRRLLDTQGRIFVVDSGATVAAGATGSVTAIQRNERTFTHTVSSSKQFYRIEVPPANADQYIAEVRLKDATNTNFPYKPDFMNCADGEKAFQLETNELRELQIVFGAVGLAGYQPASGEVFTVTVYDTFGVIEAAPDSPFSFEYSASLYEGNVTLKFSTLLSAGAPPLGIDVLREIAKYPSLYDENAVFLGNFDFLVRKKLSPFRFLSVWNEQIEEAARGPSLDNINALFVAATSDTVVQATLEANIAEVIRKADDSYRIRFVAVDEVEIPVAITARVSTVYDFAVVESQIRELVDRYYGPDSAWAKKGRGRILYKTLYNLLTGKVPGELGVQALQDEVSDLTIAITDPEAAMLPEHYRFVSAASLTITVDQAIA